MTTCASAKLWNEVTPLAGPQRYTHTDAGGKLRVTKYSRLLAESDTRKRIGPAVRIEDAEPDQPVPVFAHQQCPDRIGLRIVDIGIDDTTPPACSVRERERRALGTNLEV
jgi:hypothetical protein